MNSHAKALFPDLGAPKVMTLIVGLSSLIGFSAKSSPQIALRAPPKEWPHISISEKPYFHCSIIAFEG